MDPFVPEIGVMANLGTWTSTSRSFSGMDCLEQTYTHKSVGPTDPSRGRSRCSFDSGALSTSTVSFDLDCRFCFQYNRAPIPATQPLTQTGKDEAVGIEVESKSNDLIAHDAHDGQEAVPLSPPKVQVCSHIVGCLFYSEQSIALS